MEGLAQWLLYAYSFTDDPGVRGLKNTCGLSKDSLRGREKGDDEATGKLSRGVNGKRAGERVKELGANGSRGGANLSILRTDNQVLCALTEDPGMCSTGVLSKFQAEKQVICLWNIQLPGSTHLGQARISLGEKQKTLSLQAFQSRTSKETKWLSAYYTNRINTAKSLWVLSGSTMNNFNFLLYTFLYYSFTKCICITFITS